jgi:hypothetical protein
MKITKQYLVKVIKEELDAALNEEDGPAAEEEDVDAPAWRAEPDPRTSPEHYLSWLRSADGMKVRLLALTMVNLGKAGFEEGDESLSPEVLEPAMEKAFIAASKNPKINLEVLDDKDKTDVRHEVERLFGISQD